jgi:hypothetical protein
MQHAAQPQARQGHHTTQYTSLQGGHEDTPAMMLQNNAGLGLRGGKDMAPPQYTTQQAQE